MRFSTSSTLWQVSYRFCQGGCGHLGLSTALVFCRPGAVTWSSSNFRMGSFQSCFAFLRCSILAPPNRPISFILKPLVSVVRAYVATHGLRSTEHQFHSPSNYTKYESDIIWPYHFFRSNIAGHVVPASKDNVFFWPSSSSFMYFSSGSKRAKGCAAMRESSSFSACELSRCFSPPPHSSS